MDVSISFQICHHAFHDYYSLIQHLPITLFHVNFFSLPLFLSTFIYLMSNPYLFSISPSFCFSLFFYHHFLTSLFLLIISFFLLLFFTQLSLSSTPPWYFPLFNIFLSIFLSFFIPTLLLFFSSLFLSNSPSFHSPLSSTLPWSFCLYFSLFLFTLLQRFRFFLPNFFWFFFTLLHFFSFFNIFISIYSLDSSYFFPFGCFHSSSLYLSSFS